MGKKIKILHIQETIAAGGVERRRLSLAKHLDKTRFEQKFICTHAKGNIPDEIRAEGWEVIPIGSLKNLFQWNRHRQVQKIIDGYQPDIIHGAVFEGVTLAAINGCLKRVPVIVIEETSDPQNRKWRGNLIMKLFSSLATKVIGVSPSVTEEYLKVKLRLRDEKVVLINNGVAIPRTVSPQEIISERNKWGIDEKDLVIGSVGRMQSDEHKRYSDLIKAFAKLTETHNNLKLMLVGGIEVYLRKYKDLVSQLKINEKVIFAGYQSDVSLYYQLMDVFALVSSREAFGLVLAEAMLNRLPVVATRVGGMKYIVKDGETGILVEPKNTEEIVKALQVLISDENLRLTMGEKGYCRALENYTEENYVKRTEQLYLSLIDNN